MQVNLSINGKAVQVIAPLSFSKKISEEFDSATATFLSATKSAFPPLSVCDLTIDGTLRSYVGFDTVATVRNGLYKHTVSMTEPTKLLEGYLVDGFGVTQPQNKAQRKSLYSVLVRLLSRTPFNGQVFTVTTDTLVVSVLQATISPEFRFNTQSTLYECLRSIGDVIDALPRVIKDTQGKFTVVTFDFINANGAEVPAIEDGTTNGAGVAVNEEQYNTQLSAVVENIIEE